MSNIKISVSRYPKSIQSDEVTFTMKGIGDLDFFINGLCAQVLAFTNPESPLYAEPGANERDFRDEPNKRAFNQIGIHMDSAEHGYCNVWVKAAILLQDLVEKAANHELYLDYEVRRNILAALEAFKAWKKANIKATHEKNGEKFGSATGWQTSDPLENRHALMDLHYEKWQFDCAIANGEMAYCVAYQERDGNNTRIRYANSLTDLVKKEWGNARLITDIWEVTRASLDNGKPSYGKGARLTADSVMAAYDRLCRDDDYTKTCVQHKPETFTDRFPLLT